MTAEEARDELVKIMNDTANELTGEGWEPLGGDPRVAPCDGGAKYAFNLITKLGTDAAADADRVLTYWQDLGMDVRVVEEPVRTVYATGGGVEGLSFATGPAQYGIAGTSLCGDGDPQELSGASE